MADDGGPLLEKEVKENSNGYYQRLNKLACSNLLGNSFPSMFLLFFVFFSSWGEGSVIICEFPNASSRFAICNLESNSLLTYKVNPLTC